MRAVLLVCVLAFAGLSLACGFGGKSTDKSVRYTPLTVDQLGEEWRSNPAAAAAKYETEGIELTGTLHEIGSTLNNQTYIEVKGEPDVRANRAHIFVHDEKAQEGLKKCVVGKKVVVKARAAGTTETRPWLRADSITPGE